MFCKDNEEIRWLKADVVAAYWNDRWSNGVYTNVVSNSAVDLLGISSLTKRDCLPCSSGTVALALALMFSVGEQGYILMPEVGPAALLQAASMAGLSDRIIHYRLKEEFNIDCEYIECLLDANNVRAVLMVDFGGIIPSSYAGLQSICRERNVTLIEDFSHAQLCKRYGVVAGSIGDISICSMYATKSLSAGEGGLLFADKGDIEFMYPLWNAGRNREEVQVTYNGFNCRPSEFQAVVMYHRLRSYIREIAERRGNALEFDRELEGLVGLVHKDFHGIEDFNFYKYIIHVDESVANNVRQELLRHTVPSNSKKSYLTGNVFTENFMPLSEDIVKMSKEYMCLNIEHPVISAHVADVIRKEFKKCI